MEFHYPNPEEAEHERHRLDAFRPWVRLVAVLLGLGVQIVLKLAVRA